MGAGRAALACAAEKGAGKGISGSTLHFDDTVVALRSLALSTILRSPFLQLVVTIFSLRIYPRIPVFFLSRIFIGERWRVLNPQEYQVRPHFRYTEGMTLDRLTCQLTFLTEADQLKTVLRRTSLITDPRKENTAEHSWHFALMALTLAEHATVPIDLPRVLKIALVHDLVEIDAGDSFVYDTSAMADKKEREEAAADRIFGLLPEDQAAEYRALWDEFEAQETPEAKFAAAVDRLCGMLPNYKNSGGSWTEHSVSAERVTQRNAPIGAGAPALWEVARGWIAEAVEKGWIASE